VTTVVATEEKSRRTVKRPEPIRRPGEKKPEERQHRRRPRIGPPISPAAIGGAPIETTAEEVN